MRHTGTMPMETSRLILRPMQASDAQAMYENWAQDEDVTRFLTWNAHKSADQTKAVLSRWENQYDSKDYYVWGIVRKEDGVLMGSIGVKSFGDGTLEPGYCLGKSFWGRGYATEALAAVARHMFHVVGAVRLRARSPLESPASGHVMEHIGFTRGAQEEIYTKKDGTVVPCRYYTMTKEQYDAARKHTLD